MQLVDLPGYMINYGLGAVVTADLRRRTREVIGPFDAGNPRWYAWTTSELLRHGVSIPTPDLLGLIAALSSPTNATSFSGLCVAVETAEPASFGAYNVVDDGGGANFAQRFDGVGAQFGKGSARLQVVPKGETAPTSLGDDKDRRVEFLWH